MISVRVGGIQLIDCSRYISSRLSLKWSVVRSGAEQIFGENSYYLHSTPLSFHPSLTYSSSYLLVYQFSSRGSSMEIDIQLKKVEREYG